LDSITRQIRDQGLDVNLSRLEDSVVKDLEEWEHREEIFWKQKARVYWIQERDRNTSFFHKSVKAQRQGNFISSLRSPEGSIISSSSRISSEAVHFFSALFF